jgi:hypothetical protein
MLFLPLNQAWTDYGLSSLKSWEQAHEMSSRNITRLDPSHPLFTLGALITRKITPQSVPDDDWQRILSEALHHGLAPMLLWTAKQAGLNHMDHPTWTLVLNWSRQAAVQQALYDLAQAEVEAAFVQAGIPVLWLKGIALAHQFYPQAALRPMSDLDMLVPYERREEALALAQQLNFDFYVDDSHMIGFDEILNRKLGHHYHLRGGIGDRVVLELHYRLLGIDLTLITPEQMAWFWQQQQTVNGPYGSFQTLKPDAHLLYLCAHAILQHGLTVTVLRQFLDLHQILTQEDLDWPALVQSAVDLKWTFAVEQALQISQGFFDTPVPPGVLEELRARRSRDENVTRAITLSSRGAQWERMRRALRNLPWQDRLRLMVRVVLPAPDYMLRRYSIRRRRLVWFYYPYRWFDQARAIAWWTWQRFVTGFPDRA